MHQKDGTLDKDEDLADMKAITKMLARVGFSVEEARRETWFVKRIVEGVELQKARERLNRKRSEPKDLYSSYIHLWHPLLKTKGPAFSHKPLFYLVAPTGLEPVTKRL